VQLRLGVLTDIHAVADPARRAAWINRYDFAGVLDRCERAVELFASERVDRVLLLGDLSHDGDLPSLRQVLRATASPVPLAAVGGNHDSPQPTTQIVRAGGDAVQLPGWRAVGAGSVSTAGLRVTRRAPGRWGAARRPALTTWGDAPVLLASHFPVLSRVRAVTERGLPYAGDLVDRAGVAGALRARTGPTLVTCGHLHVRDSVASGPLLQLGLGALVEPPFDATVLDLTAEGGRFGVVRHAHELASAPERRDPRLAPTREAWSFEPGRGWRRR
jgi:Calcineurin-like phosphoesterase